MSAGNRTSAHAIEGTLSLRKQQNLRLLPTVGSPALGRHDDCAHKRRSRARRQSIKGGRSLSGSAPFTTNEHLKKIIERKFLAILTRPALLEGETWSGHRFFLGNNKEVFDAETFAIYQALRSFDERQESGHHYTVFTDAQAAVQRVATDAAGPGQYWARAAIEVCSRLRARDNMVQVRWVPAHIGIEGNEVTDTFAKEAAGGRQYSVEDRQLREASLSHLSRLATERGSPSMYGQSEGTGPQQGPGYEGRHCAGCGSPWPAGTTNYCLDMQRSDPFSTKE